MPTLQLRMEHIYTYHDQIVFVKATTYRLQPHIWLPLQQTLWWTRLKRIGNQPPTGKTNLNWPGRQGLRQAKLLDVQDQKPKVRLELFMRRDLKHNSWYPTFTPRKNWPHSKTRSNPAWKFWVLNKNIRPKTWNYQTRKLVKFWV